MFLLLKSERFFFHPKQLTFLASTLLLLWASLFSLWGQAGSTVKHFPQVVLNGGSTTSFTIHNPSNAESITVEIRIYSPQGEDLVNGEIELGPGATETLTYGEPQQTLTRGWAKLSSDHDFMATQFFQIFVGELKPRVGVLPSPLSDEIRFFGFINDQFKSGFAVHNPSTAEATEFRVRARDQATSEPIIDKTFQLEPLHSVALFLDDPQLFSSASRDFEGVVEITVNSPPVAVLSLIQEQGGDVTTILVEASDYVFAGVSNTAVGRSALTANTSGTWNTAVGAHALEKNTEGPSNTAVGGETLQRNTTGNRNTAVGYRALSVSNASANTAFGAEALRDNGDGGANTAVGLRSLGFNRSGHSNTANGISSLGLNTEGADNTAVGNRALYGNTTGNFNAALGTRALNTNTTGNGNLALGWHADVAAPDLENATALGMSAIVDASNKIRFGNDNVSVIEAPVGLTVVSDRNRKENLRPVDGEDVLAKLRELPVSTWNLIGQDPERFRHYGPMAQDFFALFGKDEIGTIGNATTINTNDLLGVLMVALQALETRTEDLGNLKEELELLKSRVAELE